MNTIISLLKNLRVRQITTVFLVGLTVFVMQAFSNGNALQAQADETVKSPVGVYYKAEPDKSAPKNDNDLVEKAKKTVKETADDFDQKLKNVKTPEASHYNVAPGTNATGGENLFEKAKDTLENVKEKLNLDEETPRATKEFLGETQARVEKAVEPITGEKHGSFQDNK